MEINVLDEKAYKAESIYLIIVSQSQCMYVLLTEGTGDNFFQEDIDEGYVDYINYSFGVFEQNEFYEEDGGMFMVKTLIRDSDLGLVSVIEDFINSEVDSNYVKKVYVISA